MLRRGGSGGGVGVGGVSPSTNSRSAHTSRPVLTSFCKARRIEKGRGLNGERGKACRERKGREGAGAYMREGIGRGWP